MADPTPVRRSAAEIGLSVAVLVLGLAVVIGGHALAGGQNYALIGPDMMPMAVGVGLVLLGGWLTWHAFSGGWRNPEPDDAAERGDHPLLPGAFLWVLGGMFVQMALMQSGGFVLAAAGMFTCVARGFGSRRWVRDLLTGLVIGLAVFFFFVRFLNVNLPAGILLPILGAAGI